MTFLRLAFRGIAYHWRGSLAIALGVALSAAVLTGALLVGDSLRGSLRAQTLSRLYWVDHALVADRFFREQLADELGGERVCPVLLVRATVGVREDDKIVCRARDVTVLGVDDRFWNRREVPISPEFWRADDDKGLLNATLARALHARPGDTIVVNLAKASAIPRESLLGRRDTLDVVDEFTCKVKAELLDNAPGATFSLQPGMEPAKVLWLPLRFLQARMQQHGRVNGLLARGDIDSLNSRLRDQLTLEDWGLVLLDPTRRTDTLFAKLDRDRDGILERREYRNRLAEAIVPLMDADGNGSLTRAEVEDYYRTHHPYVSLESKQMLLADAIVSAAQTTADELHARSAPTLVYLANSLKVEGKDEEIPYSVAASLDPTQKAPLGPFLPPGIDGLEDDEILLVEWEDSPFHAQPGDRMRMAYFVADARGGLREEIGTFRLRGFLPLKGAALDPDLAPEFPGITDKLELRDWNPPFPYDNSRIKPRDDTFWKKYRTTPKMYVNLETGQRLWQGRFGKTTSIRLARDDTDPSRLCAEFETALKRHLDPASARLEFDSVRALGLQASQGGMDFGALFLGFSSFLIVAALLLVGFLVRLNIEQRAREVGLLLAVGYRRRHVRRVWLWENALIAATASLIGSLLGLLYAWVMLRMLRARWPGGLESVQLHAEPASLYVGFLGAWITSVLAIVLSLRFLRALEPVRLLAGTALDQPHTDQPGPWRRRGSLLCLVLALALLSVGMSTQQHDIQAGCFFANGFLLLGAGILFLSDRLRRANGGQTLQFRLTSLARRNMTTQPTRSLLVVSLIAAAVFMVVAVQVFQRQPAADFLSPAGGSGGYALVAETDIPLFQDMNTDDGRDELNITGPALEALRDVQVMSLRRSGGDDASCLNLYQVGQPRIVSVPTALIERGGFQFQGTLADASATHRNPWLLLDQDTSPIPVFVETNTAMWVLHAGLGSELDVRDSQGRRVRVRIVGLLKDSVFQGELVMSDTNFVSLFPEHQGFQMFLIETPLDRIAETQAVLQTALAERGIEVTDSAQRLQAYLAVENTYLAMFQVLGGLGLLLGALGLGIVLLRNVWERRAELALLRALGYRHSAVNRLVFLENQLLLLLGLGLGTLAALLAVLPQAVIAAQQPSWATLFLFLGGVLATGGLAGYVALRFALRIPILDALKRN